MIKQIETSLNSFQLYSVFKDEPYSFFLDSGMRDDEVGKYSFIGFNPFLVFKSKNDRIEINENGIISDFCGDPFEKLREIFSAYHVDYKSDIPFIGGAVGYLSYDLCHHIEELPRTAIDDINIPDCYFGLYDGVIIVDHGKEEVFVAALGLKDSKENIIQNIEKAIQNEKKNGIAIPTSKEKKSVELKSNITKENYTKAIDKIKNYIESGDVYQVNMTQRFECELETSPLELYGKLRKINPAYFSTYIDFGEGQIVSSSPERFIQIKDGIIETRPIKGTRPRGKTTQEDIKNREELVSSEKDQAELLMIVDLERNDLGKVSKTGTVKVDNLFSLEEYPTVFHLVSTIHGEIKSECDVIDCIKATFPGGSITGAPKIRAMEIIDELEPTQRNIYTGSIGYVGFNGNADFNIAIRTIVCKDEKAYFQVGGGIVWDSDANLEYEETLHKGKALMEALQK